MTVDECTRYSVPCKCYGPEQLQNIWDGLTELEKCRAELGEKSGYIQDRLVTWGAGQPVAFWQTPSFVIGGTVITIGVTAGITAWLLSR